MRGDIEQFIQWVRMRSPQARTWRDYQCDLSIFMGLMDGKNVDEIQPRDVDTFISRQIDQKYKPSTVNRRLAAIASFYTFLIARGRQVNSPILPKRHYLMEPQRLPRPLNEKDLRQFFGVIRDARDRAMCSLMLRCGLRIGEVSDLKMSDLFLGDASPCMIIHGKGSRERTVYLSPGTKRDLMSWLTVRSKADCAYVFVSYQHKKISTTSISNRIKQLRNESGVNLTAHRLRHTFADNLLSAGMPITSIQKLMGHRFVQTTQNYAVANDKQVQADFYAASEKIDGWKLLMVAAQTDDTEYEALGLDREYEDDETRTQDENQFDMPMPARFALLPLELTRQLRAYRLLKVNRWRRERVVANSLLYFSQQAIMWEFFCGMCGVRSVSELRIKHVLQFVQACLDRGLSAKTVNGSLSALRSFLGFLKEDGVEIHPSLEGIQRLKEAERLPRFMTFEQIQRIRDEVEMNTGIVNNVSERHDALLIRSVFYLLWQGGLRSGEVEELKFSDFYISKANHAKRLFVRDGKWRKGRAVYLTDVALDALKAYLRVRGVDSAGGFVFVKDGLPLKKGFLRQRLRRIGKRVSVNVTPHRLRHTFATQLLNVGCRVTSIQKLLGHSNVDTTLAYARAFDRTVMLDYFSAIGELEAQSGGAWYGINAEQEMHV